MKTNLETGEACVHLHGKLRGKASVTGQADARFHDIDVMCRSGVRPGTAVADKWIAWSIDHYWSKHLDDP